METKAAIEPALVQTFVGVAHGDLDRVRDLLAREPALANAAWDWGGGDWETGLGAAAHMGRRDIAALLLGHGARLDIFAAAMLGHLQIVREIIETIPGAVEMRGPHGIPLLDHARAGGEEALGVLRYLEDLRLQASAAPD